MFAPISWPRCAPPAGTSASTSPAPTAPTSPSWGRVEAADPADASDRARIVSAIADADELTSALPSVASYRSDAATSPHRLLAEGLIARRRPEPLLVICAENHREAAALLERSRAGCGARVRRRDAIGRRVRWIDSVIGKMSGVIDDPEEVRALDLATITPTLGAAFLVEEFDRILVSRADPDGGPAALHPGMPVLREVDDLRPFEDAKLLGHNAIHALAGFLGTLLGLRHMADLRGVPGFAAFLRAAFVEESGRALIARHAGADPLFTTHGFAAYADDLLTRMVNPHLADTMERAARDPRRKLAWDDRLVGLIRLGLAEGVPTPRVAMGVAAGLEYWRREQARPSARHPRGLWPADVDTAEAADRCAPSSPRVSRPLGHWRRGGLVPSAPAWPRDWRRA